MLCGLYFLVSNAWVIQDAYTKHHNFPGGPLLYENSTFRTQPAIAVGLVSVTIVDITTAAIQIWRLWVIWGRTRYVRFIVALPFLCFLGYAGKSLRISAESQTQFYVTLALRIRTIFLDITLPSTEISSQEMKPQTAEYALQAIITILPTILIAGFLIFESQRQKKLIGKSQLSTPYMTVVAMLIESYAVESTWAILLLIFLHLRHPMRQFFVETQLYVEIIAYLLVLYQVANGRAYKSQGGHRKPQSQHDNISSLHWNRTAIRISVVSGTNTNVHPSENEQEPEILLVQGSSA
ncbi:hypothetical protein Agabi119p4_10390 [Agaricus bisporus var. burnettii]|uniref:Uncharacterized protein n=1 Tax=Agaricus bisporus var. burnettii TaxID=192524 RepID=A0A8H7C263_AGABI|nr:hypothetical protein Agabi119p4_10390 [Agaricus bisporus var. burnettii]